MKFYITDVFGFKKYSGNQLATFICDKSITGNEMQQIAREINFSETTFILKPTRENNGYPIRIFTPNFEVDFAGHPSLGTAFILQEHVEEGKGQKIILHTKVGPIPVLFKENGTLWMDQIEPVFGKFLNPDQLTPVLNLPPEAFDSRFPIQEVTTGLDHIIVPLKNLEFLEKAVIDNDSYYNLIEKLEAKNILIFCPEGHDESHDLSVRMFADYLGIPEDPATGSGNGCLAGYLSKYRYINQDQVDVSVGQGYEMGRPSLLYLKAKTVSGHIKISVGGRVIPIAEGKWG